MSMHQRLLVLIAFFVFAVAGQAQNYLMGESPLINSCDGLFLDTGGNMNGYGPNEDLEMTFCPTGAGENIQLNFPGINIQPGDLLCFYDGEDTAAPLLACSNELTYGNGIIIQATAANPSGCVTITFTSDATGEDAGWSANIECIQDCQTILSTIAFSDPAIVPADTGYIDICPGDRVEFQGQGNYPQNNLDYPQSDLSSTFVWNFGDGSEAVGPNVSHEYTEPGGYTVQLTITDTEGCTSTNFISQRVRVSTYPEYNFGDALEPGCVGDTISLTGLIDTMISGVDVSASTVEGSFQQGGSRSDTLLLPDGNGTSYFSSVGLNQFPPGSTLTNSDLLSSVCLIMEHSYGGDLDIELICPNGQSVFILDYGTSSVGSTNFGEPFATGGVDSQSSDLTPGVPYQYCFSMTGTDYGSLNAEAGDYQYSYTTVPSQNTGQTYSYMDSYFPEGSYLPQQDFASLEGCPLNGEWTIRVQDNLTQDNGWLFQWGLNFDPSLFANLEVFQPVITNWGWIENDNMTFYSQDSISAVSENAGSASYTFSIENDFGCTFDTTVTIDVLPITHPDCYTCGVASNQLADTVICEGESVALDASSSLAGMVPITFEQIPQIPFGAANYPNNNPYESVVNVNSINPLVLSDPNTQIESVCVNIETNWNGDINLFLESPSGQTLELSTGNGGGSDNYTNTCFTPTAVASITTGTGPFTGNYLPEGNWADLTGSTINGNWILRASDAFAPVDVGEFTSWSITFNNNNEVTYDWEGPGLSCTDCPAPVATPATTSSYIVETNDSYGCMAMDTVLVGVVSDIAAPQVSCIVSGPGVLQFDWTAVGDFTQYEIRATINGVTGDWEGPINGTTYELTGLSNSDNVTFEVRVFTGGAQLDCEVAVGTTVCSIALCTLSGTADALTDPTCFGASDGSATIIDQGGIAPITYQLDGGTPQSDPTFTGLSAGNYEVIIMDTNGCADTLQFGLNEPDTLTVSLQITETIDCHSGQQGALAATANGGNGGYSYNWGDAGIGDTPTPNSLMAGTYTLAVTDSLGCTALDTITLTQPDSIIIDLIPQAASCAGLPDGALQSVVSGGVQPYDYQWSNNATTTDISAVAAGNYCLTITDGNGCEQIACADIEAPPALLIDSITFTPALCNGAENGTATVSASGGTGAYTYQWSDALSQITATADLLSAQSYTVTVTDENSCMVEQSVMITEPDALSVSFDVQDASCNGSADGSATAMPAGGTAPYNYNWSNQQDTPTADGLPAGEVQVTITDANGCVLESATQLDEPEDAVMLEVLQTQQGCFGQQGNQAMATGSGGTGGFTYSWSNGQATATATGLDTVSYTVTVTDNSGCTAVDTILPVDLEEITFLIITNPPSCNGQVDGRLGINQISGGSGQVFNDYTIAWSTGDTGPITDGLVGGQTYMVTVTDAQGCERIRERFLPEPPAITVEVSTDSVSCAGGADGSAVAVNVTGDAPPFTYNWSNGQTTETATGLPAGTYTLTVNDQNGCAGIAEFRITEPTELEADLEGEDVDCFGNLNGTLTAIPTGGTPGYTFNWSNGQSTSIVNGLGAGNYTLTLTDANGCETVASDSIRSPTPLQAALAAENPNCFGEANGSIQVNATGGTPPYRYSLDNSFFSGSSMLIGLEAEDYVVYIRDGNGCLTSENISISNPPALKVNAGSESYTITLGDSIRLYGSSENAQGNVSFTWIPPYEGTLSCTGCYNPVATPEFSILYELVGVDSVGCSDSDQVLIYVNKPRVVEVPTGFTPNGDGTNDRLIVHGQEGTLVETFRVYDRWGELVHETSEFEINSEANGWDGNYRGKPLMPGVYIWQVIVLYPDGREEALDGQTTLIR
ncbi:MAG: proprotein convertase P-domain-containing protein [Phaeodactylibacter sp.]|uniref:proprotein convertase P-domain-containing protein n=1 Tax=Phaeodactylibacter sp. TaxID=1940289 RepID=UPI0032EE4985